MLKSWLLPKATTLNHSKPSTVMTQSNQSQEVTVGPLLIRQVESLFKEGIEMICTLKLISAVLLQWNTAIYQGVLAKRTLQTFSNLRKIRLNFLAAIVEMPKSLLSRRINCMKSWTKLERTKQNIYWNHYMVHKLQKTILLCTVNHLLHSVITCRAKNHWIRSQTSHRLLSVI